MKFADGLNNEFTCDTIGLIGGIMLFRVGGLCSFGRS